MPLPPPVETVAAHLGGTPHLSPLLRKAKGLGFSSADSLLRLAVRRGCSHYSPPGYDAAAVLDPGSERFSDAELAIALISAAQEYHPQRVRCAAQLLGKPDLDPRTIARLAQMERCAPVFRYIAEAAVRHDAVNAAFWQMVIVSLGAQKTIVPGLLPHPSRFMLQTGILGPLRRDQPLAVWLRPASQK